jgi:hypothetical protein
MYTDLLKIKNLERAAVLPYLYLTDLDLVQLLQDAVLYPDRPILIRRIKSLVIAFIYIKS